MGADRKTGTMEKTLGPLLTGADRKGAYWLPSQTDHGVLDAEGGSVSDLMAALAISGTRQRAEDGLSSFKRREGGRHGQSYRMSAKEEERMENYGFTEAEVMELDAQGVDPWDANAWVRALVYA